MKKLNRIVGMVAVVGLSAAQVWAQNEKPAKAAEPEFTKGSVLLVDWAGMSALMTDPKDQAMAQAIGMLPARVRELPREIPNMPPEVSRYANLGLFTFSRPARMALTYNGENPSGGFFGYGLNMSFLMGEQKAADELNAAISPLAAQSGMRIKTGKGTRFEGMADITTPVGPVSFGPRNGKSGWSYDIAVGTVEDQDGVFKELPEAPKGVTPILRVRMDGAGFAALQKMGQGLAKQNPEAEARMKQIQDLELFGSTGVMTYVAGTTKDESVSMRVDIGAAKRTPTENATRPLSAEDFAIIPADASDFSISHGGSTKPGAIVDALTGLGGPEVGEFLNKFREMTGVDLKDDVLNSFGTDMCLYMSESTGGGGLGSAVAMISLADKAKMLASFNKLAAFGNAMADKLPIGPGYIRIASWKDGENDLMTLRFPGLPVPLELTLAMTPKWLILSPTPQGTLVASRQASGKGDAGAMSNPVFKGVFPSDKKLSSVSFSDTAAHIRDGYSILTMVGSAVSNAMRSPTDTAREPGLTVPTYNELRKGVRPRISYTYVRGDDRVSETHSDRSALVMGCGAISTVAKIVPLVAIPAAFAAMEQRGGMGMDTNAGPALARVWMRTMPMEGMGTAELVATLLQPQMAFEGLESVK